WEVVASDYRALGLSTREHMMALLRPRLPAGIETAATLSGSADGARVRHAGLVVTRQRPATAGGFVFLLVEDETGLVNVIIRPDLYDRARPIIRGEPLIVVEGRLQRRDGTLNLLAARVRPIAELLGIAHSPLGRQAPRSHDFH
ncbi:MAG TPA: OB-fold nucleic acid binding domain-containing protein, partial [Limnochordia bacterium]